MANNDQNEFPLPTGPEDQIKRQTARHLPRFFRTDQNKKFLGGTLDPLTQPGKLTRINAYVGRKDVPNYLFDDNYVEENSTPRQYYQLETSFSYQNPINNTVDWYTDYIDYINSLKYFGAPVANHSKLNKQEAYAWDPHIEWDKFVNYREYYWLPNGPDPITIYGELESVNSTYTVTTQQQGDNSTYLFSPDIVPDGLVSNPRLTLYRGLTYKFIIDGPGKFFSIKYEPKTGDAFFYNIGVSQQRISQGILTFEVSQETPDLLYYIDNNDLNTLGMIDIKDISEALVLDVESEILSKKTFKSSTGVEFINGMKIKFAGQVTPAKYAEGFWYVEGVGEKIKLVNFSDLETPAIYGANIEVLFDDQPFDSLPWDTAANYPLEKDYIVINRASRDRNTWTRNNRWFNKSVIEATATANGTVAVLDQAQRAIRPIIEFQPNIKLFQYGWQSKKDVDFVDDITTDVFSIIEGSSGYKIDGDNSIYSGYRILFIADTDPLVYGKIFEVKEILNANTGKKQFTLQMVDDSDPIEGEVVYVTKGDKNKGKSYYFENGVWYKAQVKTAINQAPLFDLFDPNMVSYGNTSIYTHSSFAGNRIFGYKIGTGSNDSELGFPLSYMNISNVGDIEFEFDIETKSWTYQSRNATTYLDDVFTAYSHTGFLRRYRDDNNFQYINGWVRTARDLDQNVVRILRIGNTTDLVSIDVYDNSASINDLKIRMYVNDVKVNPSDMKLETIGTVTYIRLSFFLVADDKVVYKVRSAANKNLKGYYEVPLNWQNNPLNDTVSTFTFGEVTDHLKTIVEDVPEFKGSFPGTSNLANLGNISIFGRRFLQHAGSMPLASFAMTDEHANIIRSLRWVAKKYSEFKKEFLRLAQTKAYEGTVSEIVDQILLDYSRASSIETSPFYFSDMAPNGAFSKREYTVVDPRLPVFVIDSIFNPMANTRRSILVYKNDVQLIYDIDYNFETTDSFVNILAPLVVGDVITIKDYISTDGGYIPFTPSKLGLFPSFVPEKYLDNTYYTSDGIGIPVIQGHDGSIIKAYNDLRDDIILEFEKRVYNSRRVDYDISIFNIHSVIGSYYFRGDYSNTVINDIMMGDFLNWNVVIDQDFTSNNYFIENESFTYNYGRCLAPNDAEPLLGYWRGIYKYFFDTDRPHTHPWEMQGFSVKPKWWDSVYGVAPYTSGNKILWDSIEQGLIRDPANRRTINRYKRPGLKDYIPVDAQGNLLSPLDSNLAKQFALINAKGTYLFGDQAPVETAWRRSSEYPYSVMGVMCVLRGSEFIGKMWDRFTVKRNLANQIFYEPTGKKVNPRDLLFPNQMIDGVRNYTSGLVNFIEEYVANQKNLNTDIYKTYLNNIDAKLSYKIGGFTSKEKIKVLLDSRTPNASGNVFLPEENYQIFFNKSFPVSTVSYSGVLIEKLSSNYPEWKANTKYRKGDRVIYQKDTYVCLIEHVSNNAARDINDPSPDVSVQRFNADSSKWQKEAVSRSGFKVKGYDNEKNYFEIYPPRPTQSDSTFNVGGISETFVDWTASGTGSPKYYIKGQIVRVNDVKYYKAKVGHSASTNFDVDIEKWQELAKLPIIGGRTAYRRTRFEDTIVKVPYGTIFSEIQTVVDFLYGYQRRLEELGFQFDDFSKDLSIPLDWTTSAKEFMFWTLQNWSPGAVITLSPSASLLKFKSKMSASVDGFISDFHDYSIFKADGTPLKADLTDIYREDNGFTIKPSIDSADGIFHITTNLVYREHVLLLDNRSIFNDVVYDVVPGYRQGRLKILGFKTSDWDGGFTSPGFVYDEANISDWHPNNDYQIGDVVKYKNYYFTAIEKIFSSTEFDYSKWTQLKKEPTAGLIPNFDYKVEQFRDFYSLDASIYDSNQQALARHLIGYQERDYLNNVIIDNVSQYKFYQGFIKEKGTHNSLTKLFDALRASGYSSIDIKEEWAFKLGDYGATDGFIELEFPLDEKEFRYNPQDIVLTNNPTEFSDLSIYNVTFRMLTIKPTSYDSNPFSLTKIDQEQNDLGVFKYRVAGYVKDSDVDHIIFNEASLLNYDITNFKENDKIWLGNNSKHDWNVFTFINLKTTITTWTIEGNIVSLECSHIPDVVKDDIVTIRNLDSLDGTYKVQKVYNNFVDIFTFNTALFHLQEDSTHGLLYKMESVRFKDPSAVSTKRYNRQKIRGEKIWIDGNKDGKWQVIENQDSFTEGEIPAILEYHNQRYGSQVKISEDSRWMIVSAVENGGGKVVVYHRPDYTRPWSFVQTLLPPSGFAYTNGSEKFGTSIDVSRDGTYIAVGSPNSSDVRTRYKGEFSTFASYIPGDIVKYNNSLWKNLRAVHGDGSSITINSMDWEETILTADRTGARATIAISSVSRSSNYATIVTEHQHRLNQGDTVSISNVSISGFNVTSAIVSEVVNSTTFKYQNTGNIQSTVLAKDGKVTVPMTNQGTVVMFKYDPVNLKFVNDVIVCSHDPIANEKFGSKVRLATQDNNIWLYVGSKNYNNDIGRVQIFKNDYISLTTTETTEKNSSVIVNSTADLSVNKPITFSGFVGIGVEIESNISGNQNYFAFNSNYGNNGTYLDLTGYVIKGQGVNLRTTVTGPTQHISGSLYHIPLDRDIDQRNDTYDFIFSEFGDIVADRKYYVQSIINETEITIKETYHSTHAVSLIDSMGAMLVDAGGWTATSQRIIQSTVTDPIQFGYDIDVTSNGGKLVVSSPSYGTGSVYVYSRTNDHYQLNYTIDHDYLVLLDHTGKNLIGSDSYLSQNDFFGYSVLITDSGIFVGCPNDDFGATNVGSVYYFDFVSTNQIRLKQVLLPPVDFSNERFGLRLAINPMNDVLGIASGGNSIIETTFDTYTDRLSFTDDSTRNYILDSSSKESKNPTTFDASSTGFYDSTEYTGAVYVFNKLDDNYIYGDRLAPSGDLVQNDDFGASLTITEKAIVVGTPNRYVGDQRYGTLFTFEFSDLSWAVSDSQDEMVDISKFKKAFIYNNKTNKLIYELDFYDPAKGRIPQIAEQEIKYQTYHDPAIYQYSLRNADVSIDQSNPWTDEHVGEVWWDLSRLKYTWYEQGDSTYRNNNWGRLFPGSTIDVYEWVESSYLPSRWAMLADTEQGLALGISGIPREIDDFTYSSKFKYDPIKGTVSTLYYYWVKNKVTVPDKVFRNISCAGISKLILDPKAQGYHFISITDKNSLSITNVNNRLIDTDVSLNLQFYTIENTDLAIHRQYSILAANDKDTNIPHVLEQKWMDSLIGYDLRGNRVPDSNLSQKQRYGTLNSPRQTWFVNRFEALKQLFEYTNSVLAKKQIVDDIDFTRLNQNEDIPDFSEVDITKEVNDELRFVLFDRLKTASLAARVVDGKIVNVSIVDSGYGYGLNKVYSEDIQGNPIRWYGPKISISGTGYDALLTSVVDKQGKIVEVNIVHSGFDYDSDTTLLSVRPYTVLVLNDTEAMNGWSLYRRDEIKNLWYRFRTQAYNVKRYWSYVDWYADGYSSSVNIDHLVNSTFQLGNVSAEIGEIVKIDNVGYGDWLLLKRINNTNGPDYTTDFEVIGRENGTFKFLSTLYNQNSNLGFDNNYSFDINLYDQNPTTELRIILTALRDDILVDDLKIEYNNIFFNSVYYVLSEQLYVDWVFKTSFLKVNHNVGSLRQRITFQSDVLDSYQKFIEEAKPYKTKIREWVSSYEKIQQSYNTVTDFDLPSHYDTLLGGIETVNSNSSVISTYPWKNWLDNYTYQLKEIVIADQGKNYVLPPKVIISGGFVDFNPMEKPKNSSTNMNSSSTSIQLKRYSGVSTDYPMSAMSPGIYCIWSISSGTISISSSGLPYHSFGNPSAVNAPVAQNYKFTMPLRAGTDDPADSSYSVGNGPAGFWLNGVAVYSPSAAAGSPAGYPVPPKGFNYNAAFESGQDLGYSFGEDNAGGHADENGRYHYHDFNFGLAWTTGVGNSIESQIKNGLPDAQLIPYLDGSLTHPDGHSKILGWALDGYPIYGPNGYSLPLDSTSFIKRLATGYELKSPTYRRGTDASDISEFPMGIFVQDYQFANKGDLDEHNGRFCVTPDYPNGTYAYFVTINAEKDEKGYYIDEAPQFPYVLGTTYYGIPLQTNVNVVPGNGIAPVSVQYISVNEIAARETYRSASATAYIAKGKVYKIVVDDPGYGYVRAPTVYLSGGTEDVETNGAKAVAIIGNSKARSNLIGVKFDRYTMGYSVSSFRHTDSFQGDGISKTFKLSFPPEFSKDKFDIYIDDIEIYRAQYDILYSRVEHDTYIALEGRIVFKEAPANLSIIWVTYDKNISLYSAADRIKYAYSPKTGQIGKDLGQLMTGIDYGGVSLVSIDFDVGGGWDSIPYDTASWDNVLETNNDVAFISDGTTREFDIGYIPEVGEVINVYLNGVRIDDPYYSYYDGSTIQPNGRSLAPDYAQMDSIVGDGETSIFTIPNDVTLLGNKTPDQTFDYIVFRKSTSDGAILPTDRSLIDSFVSGGDLAYTTAKGVAAEDITIDGDGFVTADTSHGPEELLQGQVVDSLKINVYNVPDRGGPNVTIQNHVGDGVSSTFTLDNIPGTVDGITVLVDGSFTDFTVNFFEKTITLNEIPNFESKVVIFVVDTAGYDILDKEEFIGDGSTKEFLTAARYVYHDITVFATVNGEVVSTSIRSSNESYASVNNVLVTLDDAPAVNAVVQIMVFSGNIEKFGRVNNEIITVDPLSYTYDLTRPPAVLGPVTESTFVVYFSNPRFTIETVARNINNVAVIKTTTPHFLTVGTICNIKNVDNGTTLIDFDAENVEVLTVIDTNTFTYANQGTVQSTTPVVGHAEVVKSKKEGLFLRAPDYQHFVYNGDSLPLSNLKYTLNSLKRSEISVYKNGIELESGREYILDSTRNYVVITDGIASNGDEIVVEIQRSNDYIVKNNQLMITTNINLTDDSFLKVTTFSNHDIVKMKTSEDIFRYTTGYEMVAYDVTKYDSLGTAINTNGVLDLPRTISKSSGLFVVLNRKLLSPNIDYALLENRSQIRVTLPQVLTRNDYIHIITTNDQTVKQPYGFKIFKDMLNRTHYKVMDKEKNTVLAKELRYFDTKIEVEDGSILEQPGGTFSSGKKSNIPGVIEINGERIEYFVREGNILRQLRRGTLGTGMNNTVPIGTKVISVGQKNTIPYTDTDYTQTFYGDGLTLDFEIDVNLSVRTGTTDSSWYRDTIPLGYGQNDEIDVFVKGRRLRKSPIQIYDESKAQDSYQNDGDTWLEAEFSVTGNNKTVRLTVAPESGDLVTIVYKRGKIWTKYNEGVSFRFSDTDIARFVTERTVDLPK